MTKFGYPYNDLVICKDSTDYLNVFNEPAPTTVLGRVFQFFTTLFTKKFDPFAVYNRSCSNVKGWPLRRRKIFSPQFHNICSSFLIIYTIYNFIDLNHVPTCPPEC